MRLGFQYPSPFERANHATPGEAGFYIEMKPKPTAEHPHRAMVYTPTAHAVFNDRDHAQLWADHPGSFPLMVQHYLDNYPEAS